MIETIDLIHQFIQLACTGAVTILAARYAIARRGDWFFQLLAGAFGCYFLGDLFYTLHMLITGVYPAGFSADDLSYVSSYCFLLSIGLGLTGEWTDAQKEDAKKYRRVSLTGPVIVVLLHAAYAYMAGNLLYNALTCVPLAFLSYYTLLLFLSAGEGYGPRPSLRRYHGTVLLYLFAECMMFLTSSFGSYEAFMVFDVLMSVTVLLMLRAAGKEAAHDL